MLSKYARIAVGFTALIAVSGCGAIYKGYRAPDISERSITDESRLAPIDLDTFVFPEDLRLLGGNHDEVQKALLLNRTRVAELRRKSEEAVLAGNTAEAQRLYEIYKKIWIPTAYERAQFSVKNRIRLQDIIIQKSDLACDKRKAAIMANQDFANFGLGFASLLLSGAGSIVTGGNASQILSALSTATQGTADLTNEVFYNQILAPGLVKKIENDRTAKLKAIRSAQTNALNTGDSSTYTADRAIYEAVEYNNICSFYYAISTLVDDANKNSLNPKLMTERINGIKSQIEALMDLKTKNGITTDQENKYNQTISRLQDQLEILILIEPSGLSAGGAAAPAGAGPAAVAPPETTAIPSSPAPG